VSAFERTSISYRKGAVMSKTTTCGGARQRRLVMMWRRVAAHRKSAENAHPHYITASRSASAADVTASHRGGRFASRRSWFITELSNLAVDITAQTAHSAGD